MILFISNLLKKCGLYNNKYLIAIYPILAYILVRLCIYKNVQLVYIIAIEVALMTFMSGMLTLWGLIFKKKTENEIATILEVHPYRVKTALRNVYNYSLDEVKQALIDLATLDSKIKNGQYDRFVDFEMFLASR